MPKNNQQQPASSLPWMQNGLMPWQVGGFFPGPDGAMYQVYPDPASPTGYTMKRIDQNGTSFSPGPSPYDPAAYSRWLENTPEGQRIARAEAAQAQQNQWNQDLAERQLQVQQDNSKNNWWVQQQNVDMARQQLQATLRGQDLSAAGQNLSLLASLHGPRRIFDYDRVAGATASNPLIAGAVSTWAQATNNRPTGAGAWQGGSTERMSPQALVSDATGGSGDYQTGGRNETLQALDYIAKNPHKAAPNWWGNLNQDQQDMAMSAWEELGHSPTAVLARYGTGSIKQGVSGTRAA